MKNLIVKSGRRPGLSASRTRPKERRIYEILDATRTGPLLYTHIIHKANLSSTDADELLALLLARELVYKTGDGRYLPTTLGIKYCLAYQKMASLIDEAIPCAILDNSGVLPTVYGEPVVRGKHVAR